MRATLLEVGRAQRDAEHPLLTPREQVRKVEIIVVTSDRGLCGAFNSNVLKLASQQIEEREAAGCEIAITTAGKKAADFFRRRRRPQQLGEHHPQDGWVTYGRAAEIAGNVSQRYVAGEIDEAVLVYNEFISAMSQTPRADRLLPFAPAADGEESLAYEIEPNAAALLAVLVPKAVEVEVYKALLENQTGEHAARMAAMESATRNTEELVDSLTLQFNRARQAAITKELVEIVSGAEAL
jgi:F-type H+-transporting ATPase subunit gamma